MGRGGFGIEKAFRGGTFRGETCNGMRDVFVVWYVPFTIGVLGTWFS